MKVVVDTNVFISAIFFGGKPLELLEFWNNGRIELVTSEPIIEEIVRIFEEFKMPEDDIFEWIELLSTQTIFTKPKTKIRICRDPKDNKFLEAAADTKAHYIATGDKDLLKLKTYGITKIMKPSDFLKKLKGKK
ncbi:MAG: putative toxin-antitoxin system toxin component, PIN family [Candidatus Altiarchaeota archaeon]